MVNTHSLAKRNYRSSCQKFNKIDLILFSDEISLLNLFKEVVAELIYQSAFRKLL